MADEQSTKEVSLYNIHDGLRKRDGGPYLDEVEREQAELRRARIEGRKPDLNTPSASAGTPLVTGAELLATANVHTPSQERNDPLAGIIGEFAKKDEFPVDVFTTVEMPDKANYPDYNPADPTVRSSEDGPKELVKQDPSKEPDSKPREVTPPATAGSSTTDSSKTKSSNN